ncbi:MAG: hypothetical protein J6A45_00060, partial [Lachnospiraceae bacterium]|nr:hypothetical protein [Lachnospiraceae bacterium]
LSKIANTEKRVEYREKIKRIKADIARVVEERDQLLASVNDILYYTNVLLYGKVSVPKLL